MAKTFDELTIMDDYMFAQVMRNKKYLCPLLENILGMKIVDLKFVEPQKTEKEGYESKGVRLDIYVESEDGTIYDVEVQTTDKKLGDEAYKMIVYTRGNPDGISEKLKEALRYLDDGSVTGEYSRELDEAVKAVKASEERRLEYMLLVTRDNEMRAEGREEGRKEGLKEGREEIMISNIKNMMRNLGWSLQSVLDALGITAPEERIRLTGKIG